MIESHTFCDVCKKEVLKPQDGLGIFAGSIPKMNEKLEKQIYSFEGHYCSDCCEIVLSVIMKFKEENAKLSNPKPMGK